MATLRSALEELLPDADSSDNAQIADVIGNKDDTTAGDSLVALAKIIENLGELINEHDHSASKCYPTLAAGVQVDTGAGAWVLGTIKEIVPVNTITSQFDIHFIQVEAVSANDVYELVLYSDAAGTTEIGRSRSVKQSNQTGVTDMPFMCPIQDANTGIWAKVASSTGSDNMTISIFYHTY